MAANINIHFIFGLCTEIPVIKCTGVRRYGHFSLMREFRIDSQNFNAVPLRVSFYYYSYFPAGHARVTRTTENLYQINISAMAM